MRETFVDLVRRYIDREIPLDELEDWEASRFQVLASLPPDDPVAELWVRLQSCIAELNRGHMDEEQCRAGLRRLLPAATASRAWWESTAATDAYTFAVQLFSSAERELSSPESFRPRIQIIHTQPSAAAS
jgi:hypothetical protein